MKGDRMKETIGNNQQYLTKRSKKSEESDGNDLFSLLPEDLKIVVLEKLTTKYIAKLVLVCEFWSSIIQDKDFTELYLTRSSTRSRLLFIVYGRNTQFFHSCSQEDPVSEHHIIRNSGYWYQFSPPVRGLICCQNSIRVVISNPSTGQYVTLPRVKTRRQSILSFFGYDPINDVYKVLCMTLKVVHQKRVVPLPVVSEEHQVFTLGTQNAAWRMIECKRPHLPHHRTKALCMNGVLYYYAWINTEGSLISFDLRSEDFSVIKLPQDVRFLEYCNLVNYRGKIAVTRELCYGTLDLRVLEDASKQEWSKFYASVLFWEASVGDHIFWLH